MPVPATVSTPLQRGFSLFASLALALGAMLPLVAPSATRAVSPDLFFSEYVEGSSNNEALEIYNGTGTTVDLAAGGYEVWQYSNGALSSQVVADLTGTVAQGDVFVLAHALATFASTADQTTSAGLFNGDDAVALAKNGALVDVIGQIGVRPSPEWGSGLTGTLDNTLRRKPSVVAGDPNGSDPFDPTAQWDGFATDTFGGLGAHTVSDEPVSTDSNGVGAADPASLMVGGSTLLTVTVTAGTNPASTGISVTADLSSIGGSSTQPFADDGTDGDVAAGDNVFSHTSTVTAGSGTLDLPVVIADANGRTSGTTITLTI